MANNRINIIIETTDKSGSSGIKALGKNLDDVAGKADGFRTALGRIRDVALGVYLPQLAGKFLDLGRAALMSAADYEQALNIFRSVSGATAAEMEQVAARARELGNDMSLPGVSAKDAALAMVELSKAGLSVNDSLAASKGVLSLAKAGQLDTAQAASIAANALNAFSLEGTEASRVADVLAAAANASSADVTDLAYGFQMASAAFASAKAPVDDLATALGLMSNNGIAGSDAGTSLKTMFMNLIPTTDRAKNSMRDLNLDFYNAEGRFVGLRDMIKQLQEGTKNLTDEQRALHIENIFGADSSRAANILLKEGIEGYDAMTSAVNRAGAATELAAAQNSGFKGALDSLQSSLETVGIDIGSKLLPSLTSLAKGISSNVEPGFEALKAVAKEALGYLKPALQDLGKTIKGDVVSAVKALVKSDFARFLGGAVVVSVNAVTTSLTWAAKAISSFTQQTSSATGVLIGVTAGVVAYNVALKAIVLGTQAWAAAQALLNTSLTFTAGGVAALAIGAVVGITAAFAAAVVSTNSSTNASDRLRQANDRLKASTDALKESEQTLSDARLARMGAEIAVERAEERLNQLKASGTASSLDLREAEYAVATAKEQLKAATERETAALVDNTVKKQENQAASRAAADANYAAKNSADNAAASYKTLSDRINAASDAYKKGDMKTVVNATLGVPVTGSSGAGLNIPKRAIGTNYSAGGPTLLGEHGAEIVDLPAGTRVTPSWQSRQQSGGGDTYETHVNGNIILQSKEASDAFFERIDKTQRLARMGAA